MIKKIFSTLVLLLIIASIAGFLILLSQSRSDSPNFFNNNLRFRIGEYAYGRTIFSLRNVGDARGEYLGKSSKRILIKVISSLDIEPNTKILSEFAKRVQEITGKPTTYSIATKRESFVEDMTPDQISTVFKKDFIVYNPSGTSPIYLFFGPRKAEEPTVLGMTVKEEGIVLFDSAVADFTGSNPDTTGNYELSTLLHEFGHQLGLVHDDIAGCLMNEEAEASRVAQVDPDKIIVDFCPSEMKQLDQIKQGVN